MRIKDMKDYLKPIEKLKEYGVKSLSEVDLLAILIKSGTKEKNCIELAREILNDLDNLSDIFNYDYIRFTKYKGIGEVKAIQIVSGIELFKRASASYKTGILVDNKETVFSLLKPRIKGINYEKVFILYLNIKCKLIKIEEFNDYEPSQINLPIKYIIEKCLLLKSSFIIISHNHPSNDTNPSDNDIDMTIKLEEALNTIDVRLLDHVIIGNDNCFSLKENFLY